ncbi:histidine kinase [Chryseobacterium sp.]|uniref:sensor histidine kinase n=1 Tax=Chryseobacterium sp. TaxID=1871047 RepID=UPI0025BA1294|nr:histidine kinase [Chryseobacterium sp.]
MHKIVNRESLKDVYKMNYLLSVVVSIFSLLFLLIGGKYKFSILLMAVKSGCYFLTVSFLHVLILRYCTYQFGNNIQKFKFWRYLLGFSLGIALYLLFWFIYGLFFDEGTRFNELSGILLYTLIGAMINTIIFVLQDFVLVRNAKTRTDQENYLLQIRNAEAQNLVLKQQIQPHFLFNALNTLKVLYKKDPDIGEQYLIRLSDFLRFTISQNNTAMATLEDELLVCRNYMEMQQIRFGTSLHWEIIVDHEDALQKLIPSFSLQPLLENAIKHNALTPLIPLDIKIIQYQDVIKVSNNINEKSYHESGLKSGLINLAERYRLMAGDDIEIRNDGKVFSVSFKLLSE